MFTEQGPKRLPMNRLTNRPRREPPRRRRSAHCIVAAEALPPFPFLRHSACSAGSIRFSFSSPQHFHRQHLARFALDGHLERPTAHLAIRGEALRRHARVEEQLETLPAKRTLHRFRFLHARSLATARANANSAVKPDRGKEAQSSKFKAQGKIHLPRSKRAARRRILATGRIVMRRPRLVLGHSLEL